MHGKKRILALVGVPLGASLALAPAMSAEAHASTPGKSTASGAASQPSTVPTATCSITGKEGPFESQSLTANGFTAGENVDFSSGKRTIARATADAGGFASTRAVVGANDAVTAVGGLNQLACLNLVKPAETTGTQVPPGTGTQVPGTADREQALAAGENDGDATCRQKVDLFKNNADKSAAFRADYATGFNNKVAATVGCSAMLAQLRSGVPAGQTQGQTTQGQTTQGQGQGQTQGQTTQGQGQTQKQEQGKKHGQGNREEGRGVQQTGINNLLGEQVGQAQGQQNTAIR
ncbi:hypothetical protein GCM10010207_33290 [Streptomyces atratus]|uniref:hypothetical protein n=1 Tax=Streptomyces atratus TaxID=1893 RepID=UPI00166FE921|nr:hypothetical protein [Streptomyces atratus]GGT30657.1 hypothetical protein GCM10010207_33290 [Streptomyces atratus]